MQKLITILLVIIGLIHVAPISGVLGEAQLSALYGIYFQDANTVILMKHRAILFGLLGSFIIYATFRPALQPLAFIAAFISIFSFIGIAEAAGGYNSDIGKVVMIDIFAGGCLVVAVVCYFIIRRGQK